MCTSKIIKITPLFIILASVSECSTSRNEQDSRSALAYGEQALESIQKLRVAITGCDDIAFEIARHLVLSGVELLTFVDDGVTSSEYPCPFFASCEGGGEIRCSDATAHLQTLNYAVQVNTTSPENWTPEEYNVTVITDGTMEELESYNEISRDNGMNFVAVGTFGWSGYVYTDFGEAFTVKDALGEVQKPTNIAKIERENGVINVTTEGRHYFRAGEQVVFEKVTCDPSFTGEFTINSVVSDRIFSVSLANSDPDILGTGASVFRGECRGLITVLDEYNSFNVSFSSFRDSLVVSRKNIKKPFVGPQNRLRSMILHLCFLGILEFQRTEGYLPKLLDESDALKVADFSQNLLNKFGFPLDADVVREEAASISLSSRMKSHSVDSFFGALAAEEVIKSTGLYTPLQQWFHYDWDQLHKKVLPRENAASALMWYELMPNGMVEKSPKDLDVFVVGAGALGNEKMKILAMEGIRRFIIADMDSVVLSNLNRQFCYKQKHAIDKTPKAEALAECIRERFLDVQIEVYVEAVGPETEHIFDRDFWEGISLIVAAVDNAKARQYLSNKSMLHNIPMLESGTGNQQASSKVILPGITKPYTNTRDTSSFQKISCTVKASPQTAEHCIHWATDRFQRYFVDLPTLFNRKEISEKELVKNLHFIELWSKDHKDISDFIRCAYYQFLINFWEDIGDQMKVDPQREFMQQIQFDPDNNNHTNYIWAFSNILASLFNIQLEPSQAESVSQYLDSVTSVDVCFDLNRVSILYDNIPNTLKFQKDEDLDVKNFHLDFVYLSSLLRAQNFGISMSDVTRSACRSIAGHVDPAVSIISATISSVVSVELHKILTNCTKDDYRNYDIDLRNPGNFQYIFSLTDSLEEGEQVPPSLKPYNVIEFKIDQKHKTPLRSIFDHLHDVLFEPNKIIPESVRFVSVERYADSDTVIYDPFSDEPSEFDEIWYSDGFQTFLATPFLTLLENANPHIYRHMNYVYLSVSCTLNSTMTAVRIPVVLVSWKPIFSD